MIRRPCSECGTVDYPKYKRIRLTKNGIETYHLSKKCILCKREEYRERYEKARKLPNQYKIRLASNKKWQLKNKDKFKKYIKKYELINREKIRKRKQRYYIKNKEKILKRNKEWKDKNIKKKRRGFLHIWKVMENDRIQRVIYRNNAKNSLLSHL